MQKDAPAALAENVVAFGRLLRRAGLDVAPDQARLYARILPLVLERRDDARAAGRAIFVRRREDRATFDAAFDLFFRRSTAGAPSGPELPRLAQRANAGQGVEGLPAAGEASHETVEAVAPTSASARERLRTTDFAHLTSDELRDAAAMVAAMRLRLPLRRARRRRVRMSGPRLATRAILRKSLARGGEVLWWRWLRRRSRARPLVLVLDVSGSMDQYTRFFFRFAHALASVGAPVEIFTFGTRLTRVTRELLQRDAASALRRIAARVADRGGGTRIGASLHELNRRWTRRAIRSGAVVMIVSDGWERDDPSLLAREMAVLQRSCHRLLWLDPLAGRPGFEPAAAGLRAALPFVDALLPCSSLLHLEDLAARLAALPAAARGPRPARAAWMGGPAVSRPAAARPAPA